MKKNEYNLTNNVIMEDEYKERVHAVFSTVGDVLSKTMGPYGATTILEKSGDVAFTKDGWQVLKKLAFMDEIQNTILGLLTKISHQVNIKVGDGTTTSIVAANQLLNGLDEISKSTNIRPKDFLDKLEDVVDLICEKIQEDAIQIDKEGELKEIYDLALVSTNGDTVIAEMIQNIYKETKNPAIEYNKSRSNKTTYEIVDGYKLKFMTFLDRIFINNDNATCNVTNPKILMFDHKIDPEYYSTILQPAIANAIQSNQRLVVIAPFYDSHLLQKFSRELQLEFKATKSTTVVYARASVMNNHYMDLYNDFAALAGVSIIREQTAYEILKGELVFIPEEFMGSVDQMVIGELSTYISGFNAKNDSMVQILKDDAEAKYNELLIASESATMITEDFINAKQRISKLRCKMGVINVGGNTELSKTADYDLVEDAVKACESSYLYGIVPGQNISIQTAIDKLRDSDSLDDLGKRILDAISDAFIGVIQILLENKFGKGNVDLEFVSDMVENCIYHKQAIDLTHTKKEENGFKLAVTPNVINSCKTDIEILKASANIIGLLLSSNQYVTIRF